MKIYFFALMLVYGFENDFFYDINSIICRDLKSLFYEKRYNLMKNFTFDECKYPVRCSYRGCLVKNFAGEYFDVNTVQESYSGSSTDFTRIWNMIYDSTKHNALLTRLVSGLHYSISIHISRYYFDFYFFYIANPILYLEKYNKEHLSNFYLLYLFVLKAFMKIPDENIEHIKEKISFLDFDVLFEELRDDFSFEQIFEIINCIECDKCRILGRVQLQGLNDCIRILNDKPVEYPNYLIYFFYKLSKTIESIDYLSKTRFVYLYYLLIYKDWICILFFTVFFYSILRRYFIRQKK